MTVVAPHDECIALLAGSLPRAGGLPDCIAVA
jgi:hypothetical protein